MRFVFVARKNEEVFLISVEDNLNHEIHINLIICRIL